MRAIDAAYLAEYLKTRTLECLSPKSLIQSQKAMSEWTTSGEPR